MHIVWLGFFGALLVVIGWVLSSVYDLEVIPIFCFGFGIIFMFLMGMTVLSGIPENAEIEKIETTTTENYIFDTTKEFSVHTKEYSTFYDADELFISGYYTSGVKLSINKKLSSSETIVYTEDTTTCSYQVISHTCRYYKILFFYITETRKEHHLSCPKECITQEKIIS